MDTNIALRTLQPNHPHFKVVERAIKLLPGQGHTLYMLPQNLVELWVVATRPVAQNGLGLSAEDIGSEIVRLKTIFELLPDTPKIYETWEALVTTYKVIGKPAHDARLVAAMKVHGITSVLTFDSGGFSRYPGIEVVNPTDIAA